MLASLSNENNEYRKTVNPLADAFVGSSPTSPTNSTDECRSSRRLNDDWQPTSQEAVHPGGHPRNARSDDGKLKAPGRSAAEAAFHAASLAHGTGGLPGVAERPWRVGAGRGAAGLIRKAPPGGIAPSQRQGERRGRG